MNVIYVIGVWKYGVFCLEFGWVLNLLEFLKVNWENLMINFYGE